MIFLFFSFSSEKMQRTLVWFRNDLRVHDHEALTEASKNGEVLLLYCFDPRQFGTTSFGFPKTGPFRAQFLLESVKQLKASLQRLGGDLIIRSGHPEEIIPALVEQYSIDEVVFHEEVTQEETDVEDAVERAISIPLYGYWGSTLYHMDDIPFDQFEIPDVFTVYRKRVEKEASVRSILNTPERIQCIEGVEASPIPDLESLGLKPRMTDSRSVLLFKGGEIEALERVNQYLWQRDKLKVYKTTRNGLIGADYSSKFSPWLANGTLSPRHIYWEVKKYENERKKNDSTYWLIFELIWRDYFRFSAWRYQNDVFKRGGIQKKERVWATDPNAFDRWAQGKTGVPFIDANMRELNATGFMSNRGRQNVASFLAQNLNLDWRMGAEYFESLLLDYDPCSNYGNWAYNATVGHDPRNRYFNILNQADRYDRKGEFVKLWIPELKQLPPELIHAPQYIPKHEFEKYNVKIGDHYPRPMIDLEQSYEAIKARD
ncbi:MAG: DASH family cryptochrome [Bacteroidota bacterium]